MVGIGLILAAIAIFSCLNGAVKWLTQTYDPLMVAWARSVGAMAFMLAAFLPRYGVNLFRSGHYRLQCLRGLFLVTSSALYFTGLAHMDMASGAAIQMTGPLMVTALSGPLLGEKVGWRRWAAVFVGFIGALIIIRPGVDMRWAALFFLASACSGAFYQITTRHLSTYDSAATGATIAAVVGAVVMTPVAPFVWTTPEGLLPIALFILLGCMAGAGHFLLTSAYRYAGAATLAPLNYAHLIGAAVVGFLLFGDFPDLWTWVGAGIIVGAGLYVSYRERVRARAAAVSPPANNN